MNQRTKGKQTDHNNKVDKLYKAIEIRRTGKNPVSKGCVFFQTGLNQFEMDGNQYSEQDAITWINKNIPLEGDHFIWREQKTYGE